ncbi:MAG: sterol desaturase family protein [Saprospiraceae bacterium]|nr:sterol desaturase family protein [Saprospiraceae bacterium]
MGAFIDFFESLSSVGKLGWTLGCMFVFWILERLYPLAIFNYAKWKHAKTNLVLLATTIAINTLFGLVTAGIFIWMDQHQFGVLNLIELPWWAELVIAVLLLDFMAQYVVHFLLHKVKFMWKFHMVHHSDTAVDVTTGTRHHPGDYMMREVFSLVAILISGMPFGYYMFYRVTTIFFTYFSHANLKLPLAVDKAISLVFISPNMHKFHHHYERPWTDTNFGNIFSIWDRIFGTYVYDDAHKIKYGLDVLEDQTADDLTYQLQIPFDKKIKTDY